MQVDCSVRLSTPTGRAVSPKCGSGSSSPDKQKLNGYEGALCLFDRLTFDLEGLVTATRPWKASNLERKATTFKEHTTVQSFKIVRKSFILYN